MWSIDKKVVDFVVDAIAYLLSDSGEKLRVIQSGNLSKMLRIMFFGLVFLLALVFVYRENLWITF